MSLQLTASEVELLRPVLEPVVAQLSAMLREFEALLEPPPPKTESGMRAREYRAARRRYRRMGELARSVREGKS